jgi:uncharacterized protein (TIGR03086 family)
MTTELATILERYQRRADAFDALVSGVRPDQWGNPSPCAAWDARGVVQHIVDMHHVVFRPPLDRRPSPAPTVADDPLGAFRAARADVEALLADPDLATTVCDTPAGPRTVAEHIDGVPSSDLPNHGWDLARATGQDDTIHPDDLAAAWAGLSAMPADMMERFRTPGAFGPGVEVFGPEFPVPVDAPLQVRLLGLMGRNPNWTAAAP